MFQSYALFPHMTVAQNVAFGLRMEGLARADRKTRVGEYLELVGLAGMAHRFPTQLSGGQQQRVALARALAKRPAVLLLDEPLGALDLKLRRQMQTELSRIHRQVGTTFVFVTHDQEEALSMATRIAVMSRGRVAQVGTPREIYDRPCDRFVADFIGESNFIAGSVELTRPGAGYAPGRARRCRRLARGPAPRRSWSVRSRSRSGDAERVRRRRFVAGSPTSHSWGITRSSRSTRRPAPSSCIARIRAGPTKTPERGVRERRHAYGGRLSARPSIGTD